MSYAGDPPNYQKYFFQYQLQRTNETPIGGPGHRAIQGPIEGGLPD